MAARHDGLPINGRGSYLFVRSPTHLHRGIDLGAPEGSPVVAARPGVVEFATDAYMQGFGGYGRVVVLAHRDGYRALYAHLLEALVRPGQWVEQGQLLGRVGKTGYEKDDPAKETDGPHLHFETAIGPYPRASEAPRVDPVAYLARTGGVHPLTGHPITPLGEGLVLASHVSPPAMQQPWVGPAGAAVIQSPPSSGLGALLLFLGLGVAGAVAFMRSR